MYIIVCVCIYIYIYKSGDHHLLRLVREHGEGRPAARAHFMV